MKSYAYLLVNLGCILVPFLASFYPKWPFFRQFKAFAYANLVVSAWFILWDVLFTYRGVWGFTPDFLIGIYFFHLPIEEILFFICIPFACVFTYFAFEFILPKFSMPNAQKYVTYSIIIVSSIMFLVNFGKWYAMWAFGFLAIFLIYSILTKLDLSRYYQTYFAIYPFFLLSNGFLTGFFTEKPVVWYHEAHFSGFRIGTIPLEDSFYGMLMIFGNIWLFDKFRKQKQAA
ncbi:MAG: lycopene cyclase domain-containing protein [Chitinophagales bacterium]|jgi:lycopene cyclase domain-containing protein|nr:lycopene cyclase domain-containing protein [Chitinophagales bacterium]